MKYELKVTILSDRDPSVNLFNLSRTFTYRMSEEPTPEEIRNRSVAMKEAFVAAWPHPRQSQPVLLPVDADLRLVDRRA